MKIALVSDSFPRNMGYLGTMLPRYWAEFGADVHCLTTDLPPYWQIPAMREKYLALIGRDWLRAGSVHEEAGFRVHVMAHQKLRGLARMPGLSAKLREIRPDVVYSLTAVGPLPLECALQIPALRFKFFTGSHMLASGFPFATRRRPWLSSDAPKVFLARWLPGRLIGLVTQRCYAPTVDCAEIAWRFFGVPRAKVVVQHLGVDTEVFRPAATEADTAERARVRAELGFGDDDLVAIYTGKLTREKNVPIVARVMELLRREGRPWSLVCVGEGPDREALASAPFTRVLDFRPYADLASLYRAADVAVWPTNESTSMLDAAACGVPIIVSDGIRYREHVDGNGIVVRLNDEQSLADAFRVLENQEERRRLGWAGAQKMRTSFSWRSNARRRLDDFEDALVGRRLQPL